MKVSELITQLQNFDGDMEVQCLGKSTDWGFDGDSSYEYNTCEWFDVLGVDIRKYGGEEHACIYAQSEDLEV